MNMKWFALLGLLLFLGVAVAPNVVSEKEELPDLVMDDLYVTFFPFQYVVVDISNIGDADMNTGFNVSIRIRRTAFGIIPGLLWIDRTVYFPKKIPAGESASDWLLEDTFDVPARVFPKIYRFTCVVNPDHAITESDYLNNIYHEYKICYFFGFWFPFN